MNDRDQPEDAGRDIFVDFLQPWLDTTDAFFHEAQILIACFDRELRYRAWNRYAEKMTSMPADQVIGRRPFDLFPALAEFGLQSFMQRALEGEAFTMQPFAYRHPGLDQARIFEATYLPIRGMAVPRQTRDGNFEFGDPRDPIAGVMLVGRDTADLKQADGEKSAVTMPKEVLAGDTELRELSRQLVTAQGQDKSVVEAAARDPYDTLSGREREVLQHVAEGMTNAEIGTRLFISRRTVEVHRANVMRKLGLRSQAALIRYALRRKLIRLDP